MRRAARRPARHRETDSDVLLAASERQCSTAGFVSAFEYKHDEPLADVAVADLNGDGLVDVIATAGDVNL